MCPLAWVVPMGKPSWPEERKAAPFWRNRSLAFWVLWIVIPVSLASVWIILRPPENKQDKPIPLEALSKIHQQKIKAQKEFAEFIKTPAGKLWQKYPFWDPATCQKIAAGQIFLGMSREQAKEALGMPAEVKRAKRGEVVWEEWTCAGREKIILRFENNVLNSIERN